MCSLGPPVWNHCFSDACLAVNSLAFVETVYANDMNVFKGFDSRIPYADILAELAQCQHSWHRWGKGNCVTFDPSKENVHIIHRRHHCHDSFKILGVVFDSQMNMHEALRVLAIEGGWRLRAILRVQQFFTVKQMVALCTSAKSSHMWSLALSLSSTPLPRPSCLSLALRQVVLYVPFL
jgi:hypothetical protein